jgi:hypothetical protein
MQLSSSWPLTVNPPALVIDHVGCNRNAVDVAEVNQGFELSRTWSDVLGSNGSGVRQYRDSGLGEKDHSSPSAFSEGSHEAAQAVLKEAKALRAALAQR